MKERPSFTMAVVAFLQRAPTGSMQADDLRCCMLKHGYGKRPSAVAMHLTKLSWKNDLVTFWHDNRLGHHFMLTPKGKALPEQPLPMKD